MEQRTEEIKKILKPLEIFKVNTDYYAQQIRDLYKGDDEGLLTPEGLNKLCDDNPELDEYELAHLVAKAQQALSIRLERERTFEWLEDRWLVPIHDKLSKEVIFKIPVQEWANRDEAPADWQSLKQG